MSRSSFKRKKKKSGSEDHTAPPPLPQQVKAKTSDIVPSILLLLYIVVEFLPTFGAADVMGSQWLYLACLNIVSIGFILWQMRSFYGAARQITFSAFSLLYISLFVVAGLSIFSAINKTESLVVYARFVNTLTAFLSVAYLLYNRLHLFRFFAQVISILLFAECIKILSDFFSGLGNTDIDQLIFNLKGNAANKNILAASIVIKIPFAIYSIRASKTLGKFFNAITIAMAALAVFFINARASFLSLILLLVLYGIYCMLLRYKKEETTRSALSQIGFVLIPLVFSFVLSQMILKNAIELRDTQQSTYGTVAERLGGISLTSEGSGARTLLWANAIDYIKHHPLTGCGYGNWKLNAIPYDKPIYDDFLVSYHVHDDFLEITAESGLIAGLLYIGLFICIAIYVIRIWLSKNSVSERNMASFALMALSVYFVDAVFNFPAERPVMQSYFILIAALGLTCFIKSKKNKNTGAERKNVLLFTPLIAFFLLSIPAAWLCLQTYRSMVVQASANDDLKAEKPQGKWQDYRDAFPDVPNLNTNCIPIDVLKAKYLMEGKIYDTALMYLNKSKKINPYLGYDELLKARIFNETNNIDSAFSCVMKAFNTKPRCQANYQLLNRICVKRKDTATLTTAFHEYIKYRNEAWAWNEYIYSLSNLPYSKNSLLALTDSSLKLFPGDSNLLKKRSFLAQEKQDTVVKINYTAEVVDYFNKAAAAYAKTDYKTAIKFFLQASELNKDDYLALENIGLSYFAMYDYNNAIIYLDKALKKNRSTNGKSEFYRGKSLLMLGRTKEACPYFKKAMKKNYFEAKSYVDAACK